MSIVSNWKEVLDTANLSSDKEMDPVSKWLIITRAAVFPMTFMSGLIGGLLAISKTEHPDWLNFTLAVIGLLLAHAANNITNDYFDVEGGVDNDEYARALYAPHPILSGLISKRGLLTAIVLINLIDAGLMFTLTLRTGWPVLFFAALGLFISVFYVAPLIKLKHRGLGEPGVFLVWGPFMIGGEIDRSRSNRKHLGSPLNKCPIVKPKGLIEKNDKPFPLPSLFLKFHHSNGNQPMRCAPSNPTKGSCCLLSK